MPARAYSSRYIHAIARKCGICHMKTMPNRTQPSMESVLVAAAQPMTAGKAPGSAPTMVDSEVRVLSGV